MRAATRARRTFLSMSSILSDVFEHEPEWSIPPAARIERNRSAGDRRDHIPEDQKQIVSEPYGGKAERYPPANAEEIPFLSI